MFHILNLSLFGFKFYSAFLTAKFPFLDVKKREHGGDESTTKVVLSKILAAKILYTLKSLNVVLA